MLRKQSKFEKTSEKYDKVIMRACLIIGVIGGIILGWYTK